MHSPRVLAQSLLVALYALLDTIMEDLTAMLAMSILLQIPGGCHPSFTVLRELK